MCYLCREQFRERYDREDRERYNSRTLRDSMCPFQINPSYSYSVHEQVLPVVHVLYPMPTTARDNIKTGKSWRGFGTCVHLIGLHFLWDNHTNTHTHRETYIRDRPTHADSETQKYVGF